jgi:hypothetical protein
MSISPVALLRRAHEELVIDPVFVEPVRPTPVTPSAPAEAVAAPQAETRRIEPATLGFLESARMDREMARETNQNYRGRQSSLSLTGALMSMSNRRFLILVTGALLVTVGLLALRYPVFLAVFDQWGFQVNCGNGFASNLTQAGAADPTGTHLIDQCRAAVATRRDWSVPVLASGLLLLGVLLITPPRQPEIDLAAV